MHKSVVFASMVLALFAFLSAPVVAVQNFGFGIYSLSFDDTVTTPGGAVFSFTGGSGGTAKFMASESASSSTTSFGLGKNGQIIYKDAKLVLTDYAKGADGSVVTAKVSVYANTFSSVPSTQRPVRGPAGAKVSIVGFMGFQDSFSSKAHSTVLAVLSEYGGEVNFVLKHLPLSFHTNGAKAAEAYVCAAEQGAGFAFAMADKLFSYTNSLEQADLQTYALDIGLNVAQFNACLQTGSAKPVVDADMLEAKTLGIDGTPTIFIGGEVLMGALGIGEFRKIIDSKLSAPTECTIVDYSGDGEYKLCAGGLVKSSSGVLFTLKRVYSQTIYCVRAPCNGPTVYAEFASSHCNQPSGGSTIACKDSTFLLKEGQELEVGDSKIHVSGLDENLQSVLVSVKVASTMPSQGVFCSASSVRGDVNGDGIVNGADAELAQKVSTGLLPAPSNLCCIDLAPTGSPDGEVDIFDALAVLRAANGLDNFGTCKKPIYPSPSSPPLPPEEKELEFVLVFEQGWNMFSVPLQNSVVAETSCVKATAWSYNPIERQYAGKGALEEGASFSGEHGYWVNVPEACKAMFKGSEKRKDATLAPGWNLVGAPMGIVLFASIKEQCNAVVGPWHYNARLNKYEKSDVLEPGKAYFINSDSWCNYKSYPETMQGMPALPEEANP